MFQRGSVRVDTVDDFAYGSQILVNTPDEVTLGEGEGLTS